MKILNDDKISAMSITDGAVFSSTYAVDNVLDDYPGHPFMANSADATIKANISSGIEAIFVTGLMADVATMTINDTDNSLSYVEALNTAKYSDLKWIAKNNDQMVPPNIDPFTISGFTGTVLPSTVSSNTTLTDQLTGATDTTTLSANLTLGDGGSEEVILMLGLGSSENAIQNNWDGSSLGAGTITINLKSTIDLKASPVEGNSIHQWDQSSGATGRFEDSSGNAINCLNHANVRVGSIVTISGIDYQITKIVGDGTNAADVTLSSSVADSTISEIKNPIKIGILRASSVTTLNNPQVGFSKALKDFSIRLPLINGGYRHTPRNVATRFNVNSIMPISEANSFFDFYRAFRSKPFPVTVLTDMPSAQAEAQEYSLFCYMIDAPEMESVNTIGDYVNVNFNICEVI